MPPPISLSELNLDPNSFDPDPNHHVPLGEGQYDPALATIMDNVDEDWLAVSLNPLTNHSGEDVWSSSLGPQVGGMDFLDAAFMSGPA